MVTSGKGDSLLNNGPKLAVGQLNKHLKKVINNRFFDYKFAKINDTQLFERLSETQTFSRCQFEILFEKTNS